MAELVRSYESLEPRAEHSYGTLLTALVFAAVLQLGRILRCLRRCSRGVFPRLTLALDAGVVVLLLWAVPRLWSIHLNTMFFIQPDLAYLMCGVAALSGAMLILRLSTLLVARASGE